MIIDEQKKEHRLDYITMLWGVIMGIENGLTPDEIARNELNRRGLELPVNFEVDGREAEGV